MSEATLNKRPSEKEAYLAAIAELQARDDVPVWLARIRNAAAAKFERMRFPTTHDEDWKYTNVAPIVRAPFELGRSGSATGADLANIAVPLQSCSRLVFVDGVYQADGS